MSPVEGSAAAGVLRRDQLDQLLDAIRRRGFRLVGPVVTRRRDLLRRHRVVGGPARRVDR